MCVCECMSVCVCVCVCGIYVCAGWGVWVYVQLHEDQCPVLIPPTSSTTTHCRTFVLHNVT